MKIQVTFKFHFFLEKIVNSIQNDNRILNHYTETNFTKLSMF